MLNHSHVQHSNNTHMCVLHSNTVNYVVEQIRQKAQYPIDLTLQKTYGWKTSID